MPKPVQRFSRDTLCATVQRLGKLAGEYMGCTASADEMEARTQLVGCIIASQVRFESSRRWMDALAAAGSLDDAWWTPIQAPAYRGLVFRVLSGKDKRSRHLGKYRFFTTKTDQIAGCRDQLAREPLLSRIVGPSSIREIRRRLVAGLPGLGPKQASLLLRNLGVSMDVAIVDSHVLNFLRLMGTVRSDEPKPTTLLAYERLEAKAAAFATSSGIPLGHLDWAIWATMKASSELAA